MTDLIIKYPILSDEKGEARKAYGVGKGLMGLTASSGWLWHIVFGSLILNQLPGRVTFVIDVDGTVK